MNGDYDPVDTLAGPPRRSLLRPLLVPGVAFLLGVGAMGYSLVHWEAAARIVGIAHRAEQPPNVVPPGGPAAGFVETPPGPKRPPPVAPPPAAIAAAPQNPPPAAQPDDAPE